MQMMKMGLLVLFLSTTSTFGASIDEAKISFSCQEQRHVMGIFCDSYKLTKGDACLGQIALERSSDALRNPRNHLIVLKMNLSSWEKPLDQDIKLVLKKLTESIRKQSGNLNVSYYAVSVNNSNEYNLFDRLGVVTMNQTQDLLKDYKYDMEWIESKGYLEPTYAGFVINTEELEK